MKFQCLDVTCGKAFGWTAKKIIVQPEDATQPGKIVTYEYVVCPYCGSLDFEEINGSTHKKLKETPPVQLPRAATEFDQADLMEHTTWKSKKIGPKEWKAGTLDYGWDFRDNFHPLTVEALDHAGDEGLVIGQHVFRSSGKIVQTKKVS